MPDVTEQEGFRRWRGTWRGWKKCFDKFLHLRQSKYHKYPMLNGWSWVSSEILRLISEEIHTTGVWRIMGICLLMRLKPSQRRTRGQGVDQSTILPWGGGDTRRRDGEDTKKPERLGKSLSSLSSRWRTLRPPGVPVGLCWPRGGGLLADTLPLLPSLHLHPIHLTLTSNALSSDSHFFPVCRGDHSHALFIRALRQRPSHQSGHTG